MGMGGWGGGLGGGGTEGGGGAWWVRVGRQGGHDSQRRGKRLRQV